ncbi:MAG: glutathione S-transferase family protein [Paracoccaceae bacterium]
MSLRLHWSPDSANLPVRMALHLLNLRFEAVRVDRASGAHGRPGYLALNPQGLIPVLEDNGRAIFETGAILLHLVERVCRFGSDGPPTDDPDARASALKWLFFLSNTLHADLRVSFYVHRYVEEASEMATLRSGVARRVTAHLALIDRELEPAAPGDRGLLASPGVLDLYLGALVRWAQIYPVGAPVIEAAALPARLRALLEHLETWDAVRRAAAEEAIPGDRPFTAPRRPALPEAEITGSRGSPHRTGAPKSG